MESNSVASESLVERSTLVATSGEFFPRNRIQPSVNYHHRLSQAQSLGYDNALGTAAADPSLYNINSNGNRQPVTSREHYPRNREAKHSGGNGNFRRPEREFVNPQSNDGRLWRDGRRDDRRRDAKYDNGFQSHSSNQYFERNENAAHATEPFSRRPNHQKGRGQEPSSNARGGEEHAVNVGNVADTAQHRPPGMKNQDRLASHRSSGIDQIKSTGNSNDRNSRRPNNQTRVFKGQEYQGRDRFYDANMERPTSSFHYKEEQKGSRQRNFGDQVQYLKHNDSVNGKGLDDRKDAAKEKNVRESKRDRAGKGRNQMEVLVQLLTQGTLECLVCCEKVRQSHSTWNCRVCHHVLHLGCVTKWARASRADEGWHCPACRTAIRHTPTAYICFCGKVEDPSWSRTDCPHTCGAVCGQSRAAPCPHKCTLPCHPGPCPACHQYVTRACGCGRVSRTVPCSDTEPIVCGANCGRMLNCGLHTCQATCHGGECTKCSQNIKQECYCGRSTKEVACSAESVGISAFNCGDVCGKTLACGNHQCTRNCHEGNCAPCVLLPETTQLCPCGKCRVDELQEKPRISCLDPIPTCTLMCAKLLDCGEPGSRHDCRSSCHEGPCPPCPRDTSVRCRCGHMNKVISCSQLLVRADDARCEKKCNKNRSCGKHKCREACCIDVDHVCPLPCNRMLSCGSHRCEAQCHTGYCRPCTRDSFQELPCECGAEVIFPPVPCGTRRPKCSRPCSRAHPCAHEPTHTCHDSHACPPCSVLVTRPCYGGHETRSTVFCHLNGFSCGIACGKPLPCGRHTCQVPCHEGDCVQTCSQPCAVARPSCGHACGAPCHEPPCLPQPCKEIVRVTCLCGLRFASRACVDNARDYQRIATAQLASKMADLAAGGTVDLTAVSGPNKGATFKTLECSEACKIMERNRRLAVGLQIRNPDLSAKLTPKYSDFLRQWAKKDPYFCMNVHDKLTDLVQLAKQSKQKSRSYSFDSMNRDKRQFIHEYCEHFGCESVAYDKEPNRNVVATAIRDKSWLPGLSLLELIQRENGARKVPLPSTKSKLAPASTARAMEVLPMRSSSGSAGTSAWGLPSGSSVAAEPPCSGPVLDYFDMTSS